MRRQILSSSIVALAVLVGSCTNHEIIEPPVSRSDPMAKCGLDRDAIETIKANALDRLISDWPVLDRHCESFSSRIEATGDGTCLIVGGPLKKEGCEVPSHYAYKVAFDPNTLEAYQVFWMTR